MIALTFVLVGSFSCVEIDGGAVELAWTLRDFQGDNNTCGKSEVDKVRVCWRSLGDAGTAPSECVIIRTDGGLAGQLRDFDCSASRGVTRFEVPAGRTSLFIEPLCAGGNPARGPYQVPPPIVRTVEDGKVVTINQLLIVASNAECHTDAGVGDGGVERDAGAGQVDAGYRCTCRP